jgi:hypothetical protein
MSNDPEMAALEQLVADILSIIAKTQKAEIEALVAQLRVAEKPAAYLKLISPNVKANAARIRLAALEAALGEPSA